MLPMNDDYEDPQACSDPSMILTPEECLALIESRPAASRALGRYEGFAMASGLIGMALAIRELYTWADDPSADAPCPDCHAPEGKACRNWCTFTG